MPTLIFNDGTKKKVSYDQASRILQVLDGKKEPKDDKQAAFVSTVANVIFEPIQRINKKVTKNPDKIKRAEDIKKILTDQSLKGIEKAKAISDLMK